jgi:CHRD domain-containing protein
MVFAWAQRHNATPDPTPSLIHQDHERRIDMITPKKVLTALAVVTLLAAASAARAQDTIQAKLHGYFEVPAISTPATGELTGTLGPAAIDYTLSYSGFPTPVAAAHIHLGQFSVNGGVSAFLCGGGSKPACPSPSGSISGTIVAADVIGPSGQGIAAGEFDELVAAMRAGVTYANVHTGQYGGGEIRGQVRVTRSDSSVAQP